MCFLADYDWYAQVCEQSERVVETPTKCNECGRIVQPGEKMHHVWMQQYEECHNCDCGECACNLDASGQCPEPEFGETFDYDRCEQCDKFLSAVQHAEEDEGCQGVEARPGLGSMMNDICDGGRSDAKRYFQRAARDYPELKASGYLGRLWNRMFV